MYIYKPNVYLVCTHKMCACVCANLLYTYISITKSFFVIDVEYATLMHFRIYFEFYNIWTAMVTALFYCITNNCLLHYEAKMHEKFRG